MSTAAEQSFVLYLFSTRHQGALERPRTSVTLVEATSDSLECLPAYDENNRYAGKSSKRALFIHHLVCVGLSYTLVRTIRFAEACTHHAPRCPGQLGSTTPRIANIRQLLNPSILRDTIAGGFLRDFRRDLETTEPHGMNFKRLLLPFAVPSLVRRRRSTIDSTCRSTSMQQFASTLLISQPLPYYLRP